MKIEFPKKSHSKRRKIFEARAKVVLEPLVRTALNDLGEAPNEPAVQVVDAIVKDILADVAANKELYSKQKLYKDEAEFFELLKKEVLGT